MMRLVVVGDTAGGINSRAGTGISQRMADGHPARILHAVTPTPEYLDRLRVALAGRYAIERELGHGGMATVYLAQDLKHHRPVAIKLLQPDLSDLLGRERFLREIEIAAGLQHPNILPLYDSGAAGELLYYVMPYVEGDSLRDRLARERQLPIDEALQITREVAEALSYAQSHGLVHRDIKPANILLSGGHAVVADFGVARAIAAAGGSQLTGPGLAVGTPAYMSPEQGSGRDTVDGRSDLYALGCVLYEMLAGDPPFTGATAQAIIARHMQDHPPSLRVVRPAVALAMEEVIECALEKVPADRYATASQFVAALEAARTGRIARRRWLTRGVVAALLVTGVVALWHFVIASPPSLDANKVVVFPLKDYGPEGTGEEVALMIGSALEHTEPLKWIDGWTWLSPDQRADIERLTRRGARRITRRQGARYYVDGSIVRVGQDFATVKLRLTDAAGDSVVTQKSAAGAASLAAVAQLGLEAVNALLPNILEPGRRVDVTTLSGRQPGATASFLQGERAYARGRYREALDRYREAVASDSTFALAAFKGAQAASWQRRYSEASDLLRVARAHDAGLPPRYGHLMRGFEAYHGFAADSAVRHFRDALQLDSEWPEAWTALGEVYTHLLPRDAPLDSLAAMAFSEAHRLDPGFAAALYHLIEIALRKGDARGAAPLMRQFRNGQPDSVALVSTELMLECVQRGSQAVDWRRATLRSPRIVTEAARSLTVGGLRQPECARAAWEAVLVHDTTTSAPGVSFRWGALVGLQSVLMAQGRYREVEELLESDTVLEAKLHDRLYILGSVAGADAAIASRATAAAGRLREAYRSAPGQMGSITLWHLGIWEANRGRAPDALAIADTLAARAARSGDREVRLLARSVAVRAALARGDSAEALQRLEALVPDASREALTWEPWESLGGERLLLAELRLAKGEFGEAIRIAENFDAPAPIPYALYVPASLALRWRAARAHGDEVLAEGVRQRLLKLGRADILSVRP